MTSARRRIARAIVPAVLAGVALTACSGDDLDYSDDWSSTDVLAVVEREDGLVLVGIDPRDGTAAPLAPIPDLRLSQSNRPESAVLRAGGSVYVVATAGGDDGQLLRVDFDNHELTRVAALSLARLPVVDADGLVAVGGSEESFQFQRFRLPDVISDAPRPLGMTPVASDGHCLVGLIGDVAAPHIGFVGLGHDHAEPLDLGPGVPGGVACDNDLAVVSVSGVMAGDSIPTPGATVVVVRPGGQTSSVPVDGQPNQVALNADGSVAAVSISSQQGPSVQFVDPGAARTLSPDPIPLGLQPEAMLVQENALVAIGGNEATVVPIGGGDPITIRLPGMNTTTALGVTS